MGISQIRSQRLISNHSVNRFKSFNHISSRIFCEISNLLVTNLKYNLRSSIFVLNSTLLFTDFSQHQKQRDTCIVGQWSQSVTAIQLVSHTELNCMRKISASTAHAVSGALYAHMMEVVSDCSCNFPQSNYFSNWIANFQIKLQIMSQCFKPSLYISDRIAKMVQVTI